MWMVLFTSLFGSSLGGGLASRRCRVARWRDSRLGGSIPQTRYPLLRRLAGLWQANDVRRPTLASDVLRRFAITSIK